MKQPIAYIVPIITNCLKNQLYLKNSQEAAIEILTAKTRHYKLATPSKTFQRPTCNFLRKWRNAFLLPKIGF